MLQKNMLPASWAFGLSEAQNRTLNDYLEGETDIRQWSAGNIPTIQDMESASPCVIWLSSAGLRALLALPAASTRHLELLPKVLLLDQHYTLKDFEDATDYSIAEIVRPPLSKKRLRSIFIRALEVHNVHHDILCMTREIMLEREILERKNELLSFLVAFFSNTPETFEINDILQKTFSSLSMLFATRSIHAVFYQSAEGNLPEVSLHTSSPDGSLARDKWIAELTTQAKKFFESDIAISTINQLVLKEQAPEHRDALPSDGYLMSLPILLGKEKLGVILLLTEIERNLGRDQALALESAMTHLALSIKNACRFRMMQLQADFDALTRIHTRRHFEQTLNEEMDCFRRYEQPLSLVLVDIDDFKVINDTYGHQVGDAILRDVASIISKTIRSSDYCARFGGEEFALLLPHTEQAQAFSLAERLRKNVAKHLFTVNEQELNITISLGLSYLSGPKGKTRDELVSEADNFLYLAKRHGKNCTRDYAALHLQTA